MEPSLELRKRGGTTVEILRGKKERLDLEVPEQLFSLDLGSLPPHLKKKKKRKKERKKAFPYLSILYSPSCALWYSGIQAKIFANSD